MTQYNTKEGFRIKKIITVGNNPVQYNLEEGRTIVKAPSKTCEDIYKITGVKVPLFVFKKEYTGKDILRMQNIEIRRVMFNEYGYEKFLNEFPFSIIDEDKEKGYTLFKLIKFKDIDEENINLLKVKDVSTGVFYVLRVPPKMKTITQALAWTFEMEESEYLMSLIEET